MESPLSEYIKNAKIKCIGKGVRKSFVERAENALSDINVRREFLKTIKVKFIDNHIKKEWREVIRRERNNEKTYFAQDVELKYKFFSESRAIMKVWHQARLKVIPTAEHLYKIKCSEERFCKFDCSIETNEHFLIHCKEYSDIEAEVTGDVTKDSKVVELLSDNNDNKAKRKIALTILKKLKRRKKEVKNLMNKNKALVLYKRKL